VLTRQTARFRSAVEAAEERCREAGLEVAPAVVDEVARAWIRRVAEEMGTTERAALAHAPADFGRLIADSILQVERQKMLQLRPFGRDAVVFLSAPAGGATCCRCEQPIAGAAQAASVARLDGRGLAHPECI
jgi:hypothetical protein